MSKLDASCPPTTSWTVVLIEPHTSAAPRTDHTMNTETTVTMPRAIDSRNDVFITDHGSMRVIRSRARRPGRGLAGVVFCACLSWRAGLGGFGRFSALTFP